MLLSNMPFQIVLPHTSTVAFGAFAATMWTKIFYFLGLLVNGCAMTLEILLGRETLATVFVRTLARFRMSFDMLATNLVSLIRTEGGFVCDT